MREFTDCAERLAADLEARGAAHGSAEGPPVDLEERFGSVALDIVGKAVFNFDFESTSEESPVVKAAIRTLGEVEHRALTPLAYWKVPGAKQLLPRLQEFERDMGLLNDVLYGLIENTMATRCVRDGDGAGSARGARSEAWGAGARARRSGHARWRARAAGALVRTRAHTRARAHARAPHRAPSAPRRTWRRCRRRTTRT